MSNVLGNWPAPQQSVMLISSAGLSGEFEEIIPHPGCQLMADYGLFDFAISVVE